VQLADTELSRSDFLREAELALARRSLIHFTAMTQPGYVIDAAHRVMAAALDRVASGEIQRLIITAPPQHGKSLLTSVSFAAYWLGRYPDRPVCVVSYGADLAETKSRKVRDILDSEEYQAIYPGIYLRPGSRGVGKWDLAGHEGGMWAGGIGGDVTGRGFGLVLIDDPHKNWEESQSPTMRRKVENFYKNDLVNRKRENAATVIIMTRWHEADLVGQLLLESGDQWTLLRLPAIAETQEVRDRNNEYLGMFDQIGQPDPVGRQAGEPLSPAVISLATLEYRRDEGEVSTEAWAAEYQGVPRPDEGGRIKREMLKADIPDKPLSKFCRYWDKAGSESDGACNTAGILMSRDSDGRYWVLDAVVGKWQAADREQKILETARRDQLAYGNVAIWTEQEPGSGGKESAENTVRNLAGFTVQADKVTGSKDVRLEPFIAQAQVGHVRLKIGDWNRMYIEEMIAIPNGKYRDQGDATAGAFNKLTAQNVKQAPSMNKMVIGVPQKQNRGNNHPSGLNVTKVPKSY